MAKSTSSLDSNVSVEDLSAQIDILKNDLSNLTHALSDYGISKTNEATHAARETAAHLSEASRKKANEAQVQAQEFVHSQPATALGIAAGLGFLIGMMTARK